MTDASNTVPILVTCAMMGIRFNSIIAMRGNKRNGLPDEGVCDVQHTIHSDELFVMRRNNRNGQPDEGVCDLRHTVHSDELCALSQANRNGPT